MCILHTYSYYMYLEYKYLRVCVYMNVCVSVCMFACLFNCLFVRVYMCSCVSVCICVDHTENYDKSFFTICFIG